MELSKSKINDLDNRYVKTSTAYLYFFEEAHLKK